MRHSMLRLVRAVGYRKDSHISQAATVMTNRTRNLNSLLQHPKTVFNNYVYNENRYGKEKGS